MKYSRNHYTNNSKIIDIINNPQLIFQLRIINLYIWMYTSN
jgi:hypothetical protein